MGIITIIFVICLILAVFNAICKIASLEIELYDTYIFDM